MHVTGLDLDCGVYFPQFLESSVMQGKVEEEMDTALEKLCDTNEAWIL